MKKVLFISGGFENYGIELLSAYLKQKGHSVDLFLFSKLFNDSLLHIPFLAKMIEKKETRKLKGMLRKARPDLICISTVSLDFPWYVELCRKIRKWTDARIVFGGIHPTLVPEKVMEHNLIDYVCQGDGEETLDELLCGNDPHKIPNLWFRENSEVRKPEKLKRFDFSAACIQPDKSIYFDKYPYFSHAGIYFFTKGCLFKCSYCCHSRLSQLFDKPFFSLLPEQAIEQLEHMIAEHNIKRLIFNDDLFIFDKDWTRWFLTLYRTRINLPYCAVLHPCFVDEEMLELMKDSGCTKIEVGIENLNEKTRKEWLNRNEPDSVIINALECLKSSKIPYNIQHIMRSPGTTIKDEIKSGIVYSRYRPARILSFHLTFFPKIRITEKALEKGLITEQKISQIENGFVGNFERMGDTPDHSYNDYQAMQEVFTMIPRFPALCRFLLKKKKYRMLGFLSAFFRLMDLPEIINTNKGEYYGQVDVLRYVYHLFGNKPYILVRSFFEWVEKSQEHS